MSRGPIGLAAGAFPVAFFRAPEAECKIALGQNSSNKFDPQRHELRFPDCPTHNHKRGEVMPKGNNHTFKITYRWSHNPNAVITENRHGKTERQIRMGFARWVKEIQSSGIMAENAVPELLTVTLWI